VSASATPSQNLVRIYGVFAAGTIAVASLLWASRRRDYWIAMATAVFAALVRVPPVPASYLYFGAGDNVHRIVRLGRFSHQRLRTSLSAPRSSRGTVRSVSICAS
jgi:hypothetical protein